MENSSYNPFGYTIWRRHSNRVTAIEPPGIVAVRQETRWNRPPRVEVADEQLM